MRRLHPCAKGREIGGDRSALELQRDLRELSVAQTHLLVGGLNLRKGRRRRVKEGEEVNDVLLDGLGHGSERLKSLSLVGCSLGNALLLRVLLCRECELESVPPRLSRNKELRLK